MENQPNNERQPKRYYLEYDGKRYILGQDNTVLYLHSNNPEADHYYVQFDDDEDGEQKGHYGWRAINENFDEMIVNLIQVGCQQILKPDPSHFDLEQYQSRFGQLPDATEKPVAELERQELTHRQHNFANYFGYTTT
jgi:hypothetical protein